MFVQQLGIGTTKKKEEGSHRIDNLTHTQQKTERKKQTRDKTIEGGEREKKKRVGSYSSSTSSFFFLLPHPSLVLSFTPFSFSLPPFFSPFYHFLTDPNPRPLNKAFHSPSCSSAFITFSHSLPVIHSFIHSLAPPLFLSTFHPLSHPLSHTHAQIRSLSHRPPFPIHSATKAILCLCLALNHRRSLVHPWFFCALSFSRCSVLTTWTARTLSLGAVAVPLASCNGRAPGTVDKGCRSSLCWACQGMSQQFTPQHIY